MDRGKAWRGDSFTPKPPKPNAPRRTSWWLTAPREGFTQTATRRATETQTEIVTGSANARHTGGDDDGE